MGSSNSRIGSPSPSSSPEVHRKKPRLFSSLVCGCYYSSRSPLEMEDYPDGFLVNSSELCADHLFSEIQKPKEESHPISSIDTGGLVCSADEASNLESEGQGNLEQVNAGDSDVINHGNRLFESAGLVPHPAVSVSSSNGLDWDNKSSTSNTSSNEPQSSGVVSVNSSSNGIAEPYVNDLVISGVSVIHAEDEGVLSKVETVENQQADSRAFVCSSSPAASDLPIPCNSTGDDTSSESILVWPEFPLFDRGQGVVEPESEVEVDVSFSSCPLSSSAAGSTGCEGQRNGGRSLLDVFSGDSSRVHSDTITPAIILSTSNESNYLGSQERRLFDHTNLFSNDGVQIESRHRGSRIQRSNEQRRSRRFELWDRLRSGLYEHRWQNTSCPLGLHADGDECLCDRYLTEESNASSSISQIFMLTEALFEVLDEIHRQPLSFSLSMGPVTAPESIVESFPLKSYEKCNRTESEDLAEQCNICFAEYVEGDKIRILPCHHEYHMECVDKWLKEIHGVCPLCREDVRGGFAKSSASGSELTSS